jgi:hypothetical protein
MLFWPGYQLLTPRSRSVSEGYAILSPTQLIISLLLTLADRQHDSALFNSPSPGLPVENCYTKVPRQWYPIIHCLLK